MSLEAGMPADLGDRAVAGTSVNPGPASRCAPLERGALLRSARAGPFIACLFALSGCGAGAGSDGLDPAGPSDDPAGLPLLAREQISYLGSFSLPSQDGNGRPLGYGGHALSVSASGTTLFFGGHDWYQELCEVGIPGTIGSGAGTIVRGCTDVTEGKLASAGNYNVKLGGTLVYNGRLIVSAFEYYDADGSQVSTHGVSGTNLGATGDFRGWYPVAAAASPRSMGGYMTTIPAEWQPVLGGPALTGLCCVSILSTTSAGPAATVFDPDDVGVKSPITGTTVLYYPLGNPTTRDGTAPNPIFVQSDAVVGMAFPAGSRSVLFFGRHGSGPYCYGTGAECSDPADGSKGTHAYPYVHQVWAYDAAELVAVKNGLKQPWEVRPYAVWRLAEMDETGSATIRGAAYDPVTRRVFITEGFGDVPVVHVYRIGVP
jgi:hypothetical protein